LHRRRLLYSNLLKDPPKYLIDLIGKLHWKWSVGDLRRESTHRFLKPKKLRDVEIDTQAAQYVAFGVSQKDRG